jgi:Ni/Co efflux regulator RcnB
LIVIPSKRSLRSEESRFAWQAIKLNEFHLATGRSMLHTSSRSQSPFLKESFMKFSGKAILAAVLFSAVPLALAQDAATDVKKGADDTGHATKKVVKTAGKDTEKAADKTGHETKVVAKDTGKGTEKVAKKTGSVVKKGAEDTGHGVKKAGEKTEDAVK